MASRTQTASPLEPAPMDLISRFFMQCIFAAVQIISQQGPQSPQSSLVSLTVHLFRHPLQVASSGVLSQFNATDNLFAWRLCFSEGENHIGPTLLRRLICTQIPLTGVSLWESVD